MDETGPYKGQDHTFGSYVNTNGKEQNLELLGGLTLPAEQGSRKVTGSSNGESQWQLAVCLPLVVALHLSCL